MDELVKNVCDLIAYACVAGVFFSIGWLCVEKALYIRKERKICKSPARPENIRRQKVCMILKSSP